jgi:hypothetical protein
MNNGPLLFLGILVTLVSSFWGLLLAPQLQIGQQQPVLINWGNLPAATARLGAARR